jgi:hypothetical protein
MSIPMKAHPPRKLGHLDSTRQFQSFERGHLGPFM